MNIYRPTITLEVRTSISEAGATGDGGEAHTAGGFGDGSPDLATSEKTKCEKLLADDHEYAWEEASVPA